MKNPKIAVIVLTWNDWKNTVECIASLLISDYKNFDIVIVDNNSNKFNFSRLLKWLEKKKYPIVPIGFKYKNNNIKKKNQPKIIIKRISEIADVRFSKNVGATKAYNQGIKYALKNNYEYFVRLDCDFIVTKNFLKESLKTFSKIPNLATVSPKIYYHLKKKTKRIWWTGLKLKKNYLKFQKTGGGSRKTLDVGQFKGIQESDSFCGCCTMFSSKKFKKIKKLDEDFFFGPEDMEASSRLKKYGKLVVNLNIYTYHKVSQSIFISGIKSRIYFETIGWLLIIKKMCSKFDKFQGYSFFILRGLVKLLKLIIKKNKEVEIGFLLGIKDFFLRYK